MRLSREALKCPVGTRTVFKLKDGFTGLEDPSPPLPVWARTMVAFLIGLS